MLAKRKGAVELAKLTSAPVSREDTAVAVMEAVNKGMMEPNVKLNKRI